MPKINFIEINKRDSNFVLVSFRQCPMDTESMPLILLISTFSMVFTKGFKLKPNKLDKIISARDLLPDSH